MQKTSFTVFVILGFIALPNLCTSQITLRSGISGTLLSIDNQLQPSVYGLNYSIEYETRLSFRPKNIIYLSPQISYTSFFSHNNQERASLKSIISFTPSIKLLFRRHIRVCTRKPIVPMWYFRKYVKAGINFQIRNFVQSDRNKTVINPYLAAGSTILFWKRHRLNIEGAVAPDIYSTRVNSYKVRSLITNISLGFYISR